MLNKNTVVAFLLGLVIATAVSQWIHSSPGEAITPVPATSMTTASANTVSVHPQAQTAIPAAAMPMGDAKAGSIDTLTERLKARLEKEPNDVNGWVLLARSYHYLQRFDEAKAAFVKAKSLGYKGEEDQASVISGATAEVGGDTAAADPVFEDVARAAQQRAAQLQMPAAGR